MGRFAREQARKRAEASLKNAAYAPPPVPRDTRALEGVCETWARRAGLVIQFDGEPSNRVWTVFPEDSDVPLVAYRPLTGRWTGPDGGTGRVKNMFVMLRMCKAGVPKRVTLSGLDYTPPFRDA